MLDISEGSGRIEVWKSMADHFLDTETRHGIPLTALLCVRAGLSTAEARDVWRYEVSRAVGFNAWDMLGEWAAWDEAYLVARIERLRKRWDNRPGTLRWLRYRVRVHFVHRVWLSIERCMSALLAIPLSVDREHMADDLAFLARHYFDFCQRDLASVTAEERATIRRLYPEPFCSLMAPAVFGDELAGADRRVRAALTAEPGALQP
jgi:hypothetical protein